MPSDIFQRLKSKAAEEGIRVGTPSARRWFRKRITEMESISRASLMKDEVRASTRLTPGKLYFFSYDPKLKKVLPYYDRFPLCIPIDVGSDNFLGLNLHYLPPTVRLRFFDKLAEITNNKKFNSTTKMAVTYKMLKGAEKLSAFRPTIKRYLRTHVRSKFILIPADEWDIALLLPMADFKKSSESKIWTNSRKMM